MKRRNKVILIIVVVAIITLIISGTIYQTTITSINTVTTKYTAYDNVVDFQYARWNDIKEEIWGSSVRNDDDIFDTSFVDLPVIDGNEYFNWVDTSSLGITPWDGTTKVNGTELTWAHFTGGDNDITKLKTEYYDYKDSYEDGTTGEIIPVEKEVTYYVADIYTAEELRWVLDEVKASSYDVKINLLNDIDLNGQNGIVWESIDLSGTGMLYIEGNGHTIYNFRNSDSSYLTGSGFFSDVNKTLILIMKNLSFNSNLIVTTERYSGIIYGRIRKAFEGGVYFYNLNTNDSFVQSSDSDIGGCFGRCDQTTLASVFMKKCFSSNAYLCGGSHIGGFAGCQSFKGTTVKVRYNADFPNEPEAFLDEIIYPEMIDECYSVDCEVFSTEYDSGAFISCGAGINVRNSFTNNTVYSNTYTGVFLGRMDGGSLCYDDNGSKTIDMYFDNCYSSGIIEGQDKIGGFVGSIGTSTSDGYSEEVIDTAVIFKDCYTTSMVGMEYSGANVGGFMGKVITESEAEYTININGIKENFSGVTFINCYAAGEVGDIATNTDCTSDNKTTIGGFIGSYSEQKPNFINCYYDKQTTGMRERGIGYVEVDNIYSGQVDGLTGVYTVASSLSGGTAGLTGSSGNHVDMGDDSAWVYREGLYPQLKVFVNDDEWEDEILDVVEGHSQASASTIFLDHYDYIMTDSNQTYNVQSDESYTPNPNVEENNLIYDTIRDITQSFEFSSAENTENIYSDIDWYVDSEMNESRGFVEGFNIDYGETNVVGESEYSSDILTIINPARDTDGIDPDLLELMEELGEMNDVYKCYSFVPGKSWVSVEVKNDDGEVIGSRRLRLLPMAHIESGNYAEITIEEDGSNNVIYTTSDNQVTEYDNTTYKHDLDTIYTITNVENLGTYENYLSQEVSKSTNTKFAMWGRYPSSLNTGTSSSKFDGLYTQEMIGDSTNGLTKVELYKLDVEYITTQLSNGQTTQVPRINYDGKTRITGGELDNEKWTGNTEFTTDDTGWYELEYYWRMNDGRYLIDSKIVVIKRSTYTASITNEVYGPDCENTEIMPDLVESKDYPDALAFDGDGVEVEYEDGYITKTKSLENFMGEEVIIGWLNDEDYQLVDLIIEVSLDGATWIPLTFELNDPDNPYDFEYATYTYYYQDYVLVQNPATKEYYLLETTDPKEITMVITPLVIDDTKDEADAEYLYVLFQIVSEEDDSIKSVNSSIRVTTVSVPRDTLITAKKYVDKEAVYDGEELEYTVIFTPEYFNSGYDINAYDTIPDYAIYVEGSLEIGEYDASTDTYIKYEDIVCSYDEETKILSWYYDRMDYGKQYYARFNVIADAKDMLETEDFVRVYNYVDFDYVKVEDGEKVQGGRSEAASFIIMRDEKVYLLIEKEVSEEYAPVWNFEINLDIENDGEKLTDYIVYTNYEEQDDNDNLYINQEESILIVGNVGAGSKYDGASYTVTENQDTMPKDFYFSSITNDGKGTLKVGELNKVTITNYYTGSIQHFGIKKVNEENKPLEGIKFEITDEEGNSWIYTTDENGEINISLNYGEYVIREVDTVYGYNLNEEEYCIEVNENGIFKL